MILGAISTTRRACRHPLSVRVSEMRLQVGRVLLFLLAMSIPAFPSPAVHLWEKQELTFTSAQSWANPYTDVTVWVDLAGPGFKKRIYGFWDGDRTFRVRLLAPAPGDWSWQSGSNPADPGLRESTADSRRWLERGRETKEPAAPRLSQGHREPSRRSSRRTARRSSSLATPGIPPRPTDSGGTTTIIERPLGPEAGFKDYLRYRKAEGYNAVAIIAVFPAWATDGYPVDIFMNDRQPACAPRGPNMAPRAPRTWRTKAAGHSCFQVKCPATRISIPTSIASTRRTSATWIARSTT